MLYALCCAGPKGEGGLDDATGASGAAGGASYKQTSRATQLGEVWGAVSHMTLPQPEVACIPPGDASTQPLYCVL